MFCGLAIPVYVEGREMLTFCAGALWYVCVGSRGIYGTIIVQETSERFCKYTHTRHAPSRLSVLPAQISRASCLTFLADFPNEIVIVNAHAKGVRMRRTVACPPRTDGHYYYYYYY